MRQKKTFLYSDELNDDFASTKNIQKKTVSAKFPYLRKNPLWCFFAFVVYRFIVTPIVWLYCKLRFGMRIKGRKNLRHIKGGYVLYGNHTQSAFDAFSPTLLSFPRKAFILTGAQTVSIFGIRHLVQMLGAMPLPTDAHALPRLEQAVQTRLRHGNAVCIYPEAHIWPFYTKIRPFRAGSFAYPVRCGVPAVPFAVTYRTRKLFRNGRPLITIHVGAPIYPDTAAPERAERQRLRDESYRFMCCAAAQTVQPEYIRYRKKEAESTEGNAS